jgi:hypothetical protein
MKTWVATVVRKEYYRVSVEMPDDASIEDIKSELVDETFDVDYDDLGFECEELAEVNYNIANKAWEKKA